MADEREQHGWVDAKSLASLCTLAATEIIEKEVMREIENKRLKVFSPDVEAALLDGGLGEGQDSDSTRFKLDPGFEIPSSAGSSSRGGGSGNAGSSGAFDLSELDDATLQRLLSRVEEHKMARFPDPSRGGSGWGMTGGWDGHKIKASESVAIIGFALYSCRSGGKLNGHIMIHEGPSAQSGGEKNRLAFHPVSLDN